jgi:tetratricopeptide (TPR) repeat protein
MKSAIRLIFLPALILIFASSAFAQSDLDKAAKKAALKRCRSLLRETVKEVEAGNYSEALVLLDSVLICDDDNPDGYYHKGRIHYLQGDTAKAVSFLSTGVEKAPKSTRLKLLLAKIEIERTNFDTASALVDSVLAIKPRESQALYLKGLYYLSQGDTTQAIDVMGRALDYSLSGKK